MTENNAEYPSYDIPPPNYDEIPTSLKSGSETALTYKLKWAAWHWLYAAAGCRAIGMEVRLEGPFGRVVDLVGVGKNNLVYIIEVKSSRADLKRDDKTAGDRKRAQAQLATLQDAANLTATVLNDARKHAVENTPDGSDWRDDATYRAALRDNEDVEKRLDARDALPRDLIHQVSRPGVPSLCRLPLPHDAQESAQSRRTATLLGTD